MHRGISRRQFLDRAQNYADGDMTAALFQVLKPNYAWAIQVSPDDKRIKAESATVASPQGNGEIKGYLVRPASSAKLPVVLVVRQNRGLNLHVATGLGPLPQVGPRVRIRLPPAGSLRTSGPASGMMRSAPLRRKCAGAGCRAQLLMKPRRSALSCC